MQEHSGSAPRQGNKRSADPRPVGDPRTIRMAARRLAFPRQTNAGDRIKCKLARQGVEPRHPGFLGPFNLEQPPTT